MDTHAFASLAHIRILLLPVGTISQSSFDNYAAEIRSFETLRLGDIPSDSKDERARFMPSPLSTGSLHLSFPSHPPPHSHLPLSLLRPSHFPLAVIGVAACSQTETLSSTFPQFNAALLDIFPSGAIFPLARTCFVFEESDGNTTLGLTECPPGLVVLPSMMGNKKLYIGTLLADLCSQILGEVGVLVQALESPLGNEYLNASLMPILPPLSDIPSPLDRGDSATQLTSHNSQPEMSRASFNLSAPPPMKRNVSSGPAFRQSSLGIQAPKKRLSTIGTSSSHGRLYKVLGDFFLLAGRIEDATIWYMEAVQLFKSSNDSVWHAATLEGMATILIIEAWSAGHGLHDSTVPSKEPWAEACEKLIQATALYHKSSTSDGEQIHSLLTYLFCSCVLRHSFLLYSVWSAKGWGPPAFTAMLQPGTRPYFPPTLSTMQRDAWVNLERLSSISGVSRSSISATLAQLHGPWLLHLGPRERVSILEAMASIYSCLGYMRKEAYILREVLGCLLDLMVCGREEDGFSDPSSVTSSAGLGIQPTSAVGVAWGNVGVRLSESVDGNSSILHLLIYVCQVLGIDLEAVQMINSVDRVASLPNDRESILKYEEEVIEGFQEPYGWPELQVGVVREAVAVAEALPDFPSVAQFALSSLKILQSVLSPGDQFHLYSTSTRALITASRRGDARSVEYWSGRPVISIELAPLPSVRLPIEKPWSAIQLKFGDPTPLLQGRDPFLYNPRKAMVDKEKSLVVENENLDFLVLLQNPYIFDLELEKVSLSTSGVEFDSESARVVIPANSIHQVILSGKALQSGVLTIRGCIVQALGGVPREYILPLYSNEEEQKHLRKRSLQACEAGRAKHPGLASFAGDKERRLNVTKGIDEQSTITSFRFLECKVVPEQPLLRIRRTSVTHGALMLYDGESSTIRLTIDNISSIPVNFLRLAFEDSTIAHAQQTLAEGNLSVYDTYETEHDLINRPVFSWTSDESRPIAPNQNLTLTLSCFGKVGCTHGTIHISYAHLAHQTPAPEVFYLRQVSYPLTVTVYHMLECCNMEILPFPSYAGTVHKNCHSREGVTKELVVDQSSGWCLFSIEVRNTYGLPFDVKFDRIRDGATVTSIFATIPPGSMSRLAIPLNKIVLNEEQLSRPIPTLSDRQFVVTKTSLSEAELRTQRELFWYREELLKSVRGHWQETGGVRTGELSLRDQRLTLPMLKELRLETVEVTVKLGMCEDEGSLLQQSGSKYHLKSSEFVHLCTRITNLSDSSLVFTMDIEVDPSDCVVCEGALTDIAVGRMSAGESREVVTTLCFLAVGRFEVSTLVRPFGPLPMERGPARAQLTAVVLDHD